MNKHKAAWTPEKRAAQSKVMKRIWAARRQAVSIEPPPKNWLQRIWDIVRGAH